MNAIKILLNIAYTLKIFCIIDHDGKRKSKSKSNTTDTSAHQKETKQKGRAITQ